MDELRTLKAYHADLVERQHPGQRIVQHILNDSNYTEFLVPLLENILTCVKEDQRINAEVIQSIWKVMEANHEETQKTS